MFAAPSILSEAKRRASRSPIASPIEESGTHSDSETTTRKRKATYPIFLDSYFFSFPLNAELMVLTFSTWDPPTLRPRPARIVVKTEGSNGMVLFYTNPKY